MKFIDKIKNYIANGTGPAIVNGIDTYQTLEEACNVSGHKEDVRVDQEWCPQSGPCSFYIKGYCNLPGDSDCHKK